MEVLAERMAAAVNKAQTGTIIDQSEEPVREAHADFRQRAYQKALNLLEPEQQAFSPSEDSTGTPMGQ